MQLASHPFQRDRAWKTFRYPCIGRYGFLEFSIGDHSIYPNVLDHLKNGATLLDLGCCFGQDIRKLVFDGAPATNLTGSELDADFIALGYDLFRDKDRLQATFETGDFFAAETAGLQKRSYDYIHASAFFHLFSRKEQIEAIAKCVALLKRQPGSTIFGRQAGTTEPGELNQIMARSGTTYRHNEESFKKIVDEVGVKTGVDLDVQCIMGSEQRLRSGELVLGLSTWMRQKYTITVRSASS